ncbi:YIP1 family protein [Paenibacillus sp. MBLB4367]|uniref:YIP1 family protein n=1 Tax=Paenibacillus sp. MBLB4367 TaxID=3384767 RepID=UPI00390805BA
MSGKKITIVLLALFMLALGAVSPVAAAAPDSGYNYSFWGEPEPAPFPYTAGKVIYGQQLGIGELNAPQDLAIGPDGGIYIADTENNRIVVTDENGSLRRVIDSFENGGKKETFNKPYGVYVDGSSRLYIADTFNGRIVLLKSDGTFIRSFGAPKSSIIPQDFQYIPLKLSVDKAQRMYVAARGAFEGILEFDGDGNFRGYVGTNKVRFSPADLLWKRISTREQTKQMMLFLPVEFSNLDLDERGFIYATSSEVNASKPIKRVNPGGEDVLRREGYFPPIGDISAIQVDATKQGAELENQGGSVFIDVVSDVSGMYSGLDSQRNRIFTYNRDGDLLYQFGGAGMTDNQFKKPTAIGMAGEKMAVLDSGLNRLTVFEPTRYGKLIREAVKAQDAGKESESAKAWEEVLKLNANFDIAYIGLGKTLMKRDDNKTAMAHFENGSNRTYYSEAFKRYRKEVVWDHFGTIMTSLLAVIAVFAAIRFWLKRRAESRFYVDTVVWKAPFQTILRPFNGFWELKYENKGKVGIALLIVLLLVVTMIMKRQYSGFVVNFNKLNELNSVDELKFIVLPFLLWCVSNWSLTTLMDGEGKFRDIVMATGYAMLPLILIFIPQIAFSNVITQEESAFYYLLDSIAYLWFIWLLFVGIMTVHQYSIGKTIVTMLLTLVVMAFVIFLGLLCFSLLQQMYVFLYSVYRELSIRF